MFNIPSDKICKRRGVTSDVAVDFLRVLVVLSLLVLGRGLACETRNLMRRCKHLVPYGMAAVEFGMSDLDVDEDDDVDDDVVEVVLVVEMDVAGFNSVRCSSCISSPRRE